MCFNEHQFNKETKITLIQPDTPMNNPIFDEATNKLFHESMFEFYQNYFKGMSNVETHSLHANHVTMLYETEFIYKHIINLLK